MVQKTAAIMLRYLKTTIYKERLNELGLLEEEVTIVRNMVRVSNMPNARAKGEKILFFSRL